MAAAGSGAINAPGSSPGTRPGTAANSSSGTSTGSTSAGAAGAPGSGSTGTTSPAAAPNPMGSTPATMAAAQSRVDNPFAGARGYVNPEWKAKAMAERGGERIANTPTGVWLDRIAAIAGSPNSVSNGPMGLRDHLDAALAQGAGYIQIVVYDLPGRDCAALASNGELGPTDLPRYKTEYIDAIAAILSDTKYRTLRVIAIVEIDSLPNLVTNTNVSKCADMKSNGGYVQGIAYALSKLGAIENVYNYLDAGHHGWIGWDNNFNAAAELFAQTARMAGFETVHGFITNTANYSALSEPYLGQRMDVKTSKFVSGNPYVDEVAFAGALRTKLIALGFDAKLGMLIDTSRNGWGGPQRPSAASTAMDVDMFVEQSRIDRRIHVGNWCNQAGAGLGERPRESPAPGIDAYVWIKPPGESDGASMEIANTEGKGFDRMCDPSYGGNERNANNMSGALSGAPLSGAWFSAQFQELMANAYPPL